MSPEHKNKNYLFLIRKKKGLEQKQIARCLGHKTTDQISRYERGVKFPSLKTAIKLQIIYRMPIQTLFDGYYESALRELEKQEQTSNILESGSNLISIGAEDATEFCTFEERLKPIKVAETDLNKARHHIAELIRIRGERMNHLTLRQ